MAVHRVVTRVLCMCSCILGHTRYDMSLLGLHNSPEHLKATVTDVLPKMDRPWKQTQPTGCSLSHQCPECSGYVLRVITTHIQTEGKTKVN